MFGHSQARRSRGPLVAVACVALLLGGGLFWYLNRVAEERDARPPSTPGPSTTARDDPASEPPAAPATRPPPRRRATPVPSSRPGPIAPPPPELRVDSDVAGAMVFVNRKFIGRTPLVTHSVLPGTHQLNVVAEGYDAVVRTIEVDEEGASIDVALTTVTLDEAVAVVHKHAFGSCEGRLEASLQGLRYVTSHTEDAFSLSWSEVGSFSVDYLDKTLRVEQQGGRTWNFTTRAENADPLFVFHRDVEKARQQAEGR